MLQESCDKLFGGLHEQPSARLRVGLQPEGLGKNIPGALARLANGCVEPYEYPIMHLLDFWMLAGGLLVFILASLEAGRRIGIRRREIDPEGAGVGLGAIEGAVFGLMGLLIAFTFSGAATRFDGRRQLVGEEANAIGTAYLRIDLLPAAAQPALREDFRNYVDARLAVFELLRIDANRARQELALSGELQGKIWNEAVAACKDVPSPAVPTLVLSSLNEMIDITTTRTVAAETHPPKIIFYGLGLLVIATSLLAGYGMAGAKKRSWMHMMAYALITASTLYVILDMEYPRIGLIRVDAADHVLVDVRNSMK